MTTPEVPGRRVREVLGIVWGMSVRTRGVLGRLIAGLETVVGGRGIAYLHELEKARSEALEDLRRNAERMGADAVVGIDMEMSEVLEGFIIITAWGTAVKLE